VSCAGVVAKGGGLRLATRKGPSLQELFREHGPAYVASHSLSSEQGRLLDSIQACRTAALGGRLYVCDACGVEIPLYNSCRNRHCPACQALDQARWIEAREERILPVGHHHVVFTLPSELRPLARRHAKAIYALLFEAAAQALELLARETLGAQLGVTAVLHTWTRELLFHPYVHCVVSAGGLSLDGRRWVARERFLFPVARMKAVFRGRILAGLERLRAEGRIALDDVAWRALLRSLPKMRKWVVYTEAPFGRSTHVIRYLGRYTHRIAISDARLLSIDARGVTFRTHGDERTTLPPEEFLRRFLMHVLPRGFHKIRHFGLYGGQAVNGRLALARTLLGEGDGGDLDDDALENDADPETVDDWASLVEQLTGESPLVCPVCERGRLILQPQLIPRAPRRPP
jgi:hypothetical protein